MLVLNPRADIAINTGGQGTIANDALRRALSWSEWICSGCSTR